MANLENLTNAAQNIVKQTAINEMMNLSSSAYSGIMESLIGLDISQFCEFNQKNDAVMRFHMARNDVQKSLLKDGFGSGAYVNGDSTNDSQPVAEYSYAINHNYKQFSSNISRYETEGKLNTSEITTNGKRVNSFFDYDNSGSKDFTYNGLRADVKGVTLAGNNLDSDSMLYKTRRLFNANKIHTIISQFHTKPDIQYNGQVRTQYGESHGRNLLTKAAESGNLDENHYKNGFDNPYCRVWTHHYLYDRFSKTLRHKKLNNEIKNSINYWGEEFEWNEQDKHHQNYIKLHGGEGQKAISDGEQYDYSWRGAHNQERRRKYSVLDEETGLVTIAPKYVESDGNNNVHTKSCMFSIENLAWKDYDPYSFEQALSWEQRGPLGGRIMWFPPYNLRVTETNTAKWSSNDFIGRGESVYTYINSERSGTLTFTMLVDHPSSVDYSSWYDNSDLHSDNDYHRYFAGCFGDKPNQTSGDIETRFDEKKQTLNGTNGGDNLIELPPYLTDEYIKTVPNIIKARETVNAQRFKVEPNAPTIVEFYVFFPNNYSGVYDMLGKLKTDTSQVDPIYYLLIGKGAQKKDGWIDIALNKNVGNVTTKVVDSGYEMVENVPLGDNNGDGNYIIGLKATSGSNFVADGSKKWFYRVDSYIEQDGRVIKYGDKNTATTNTISQKFTNINDYIDNQSYGLNSNLQVIEDCGLTVGTDGMYTFADVACAMYSEDILNNSGIYNFLLSSGVVNKSHVKKLTNIFTTMSLSRIEFSGTSNEQGDNASATVNDERNKSLAVNRGQTVLNWLTQYDKFKNVPTKGSSHSSIEVDDVDKKNINSKSAKALRNAHIRLEFSSIEVKSETQTNNVDDGNSKNDSGDNKQYRAVVGYDFISMNWIKITPENVQNYLKDGIKYYEKLPDEDYTPNGVTYVQNVEGMKWAYESYFNRYLENAKDFFKAYIGSFSSEYEYKKGQICFFDNDFYASKQDFVKEYTDEKGTTLNYNIRGDQYKDYFGFRYIGSKKHKKDEYWDYYIKEPGMTYFVEDNSVNDVEDTKNNSDPSKATKLTTKQLIDIASSGQIKPSKEKFDENSKNYKGEFTPDGIRAKQCVKGDIVKYNSEYYVCKVKDLNTQHPGTGDISFVNNEWDGPCECYSSEDVFIMKKVAATMCKTFDEYKKLANIDDGHYIFSEEKSIIETNKWQKYGTKTDKADSYDKIYSDNNVVNTTIDVCTTASEHVASITSKETDFMEAALDDDEVLVNTLKFYISLYNLLDYVIYVVDDKGEVTPACPDETQVQKLMNEKKAYDDDSNAYESDCNNVWIDRGDGLLILECEIDGKNEISSGDKERGDELNKLRYDKEYHFYRKYMADHPFVFEKLTEKIKYFNPAFHSMTPEGFNGRLTFLNQCTRQGATLTRSDALGGSTANNLAFGRPPFCVLRLGDFYNQMIVIDSVNYNYDVSSGLQWDLNPEGNGVQPMLCEVSINFKFIGGGDITGPVRRLQNAMSFNYYANTSFYDNRADRVEYEHNEQTMGGAGNNKVLGDKSYTFEPMNYKDDKTQNITYL